MSYDGLIASLQKRKSELAKQISWTSNTTVLSILRTELDDVEKQIKKYSRMQFEENYERVGYGDEQ